MEGNLDFFLSQFFKSNLNEKEVNDILPLLYWFAEKGTFYNLTPKEFKNKLLFNSILQKDVFSIMEIKKYKLNLENNNEKIKSMEIELKNNNIDIENKINNFKEIVQFSSEIKEIKIDLLHKKLIKYQQI